MKNIILFLLFIGLLSGCYDEYRLDYPHTTVAFSNATGGLDIPGVLARTVVKGEGLKLDMGVYLSGVLENGQERWVEYEIDESLLAGTDFELLPSDYYTLSDGERILIKSGDYIGRISVELDSSKFLNDPKAVDYNYALPLRLTGTSEDSILSSQATQILAVKYINRHEGFYDNKVSFVTYSSSNEELNSGSLENVITAYTIGLDTILINGLINGIGADYKAKLLSENGNIFMEYIPNIGEEPVIENVALISEATTSHVSPWEKLEAVNDGDVPSNSVTKAPGGAYGNWDGTVETWNWVQYEFPETYEITKSEIYWWTDNGGILFPFNWYLEYWDLVAEEWKLIPNPVVNGVSVSADDFGNLEKFSVADPVNFGVVPDMFNTTTFEPIVTNKVRIHMASEISTGFHEWQVTGKKGKLSGYEQATIEKITVIGDNSYNAETSTFNLNYRVDYVDQDHHTDVSSTMVWRNRIRDGVNEWRR